MAPKFPLLAGFARMVAAASRAVRPPAPAVSSVAPSCVGARDLALKRYAARHPQRYVKRDASKRSVARVRCGSASSECSTVTDQQSKNVTGPYGPVNRVVFEAEEKDLESDEALWALYERWCQHFKINRDHDEMSLRFDTFKDTVFTVKQVNNSDLSYELEINKFADQRASEIGFPPAMLARRAVAWRALQKEEKGQRRSFEEDWKSESKSSSIIESRGIY